MFAVDDDDDDDNTGKFIFSKFAANLFPISNAVTYILDYFCMNKFWKSLSLATWQVSIVLYIYCCNWSVLTASTLRLSVWRIFFLFPFFSFSCCEYCCIHSDAHLHQQQKGECLILIKMKCPLSSFTMDIVFFSFRSNLLPLQLFPFKDMFFFIGIDVICECNRHMLA